MLYLDSSALVKCYFQEVGSSAVIARASEPTAKVCTSVLSFAEVQSTMARKLRERRVTLQELAKLREMFERDWTILFNVIELNLQTMAALPKLLERFPLKAGDAVQLSAAIWLRTTMQSEDVPDVNDVLEFGVADRVLADIANRCGLQVFNPEEEV